MKAALQKRLDDCKNRSDRPLAFQQVLALQRSCLQMACLAAIDLYDARVRPMVDLELNDLLLQMLAPTDGTPVQFLDLLVPSFRTHINPRLCSGWFANEPLVEGGDSGEGLARRLESWVTFRNNRPGHGVLDRGTIDREFEGLISLASLTLSVLAPLFPEQESISGATTLMLQEFTPNVIVRSCPSERGDPVVVRSIRNRRGVWGALCQTLSMDDSRELTLSIDSDAPLLAIGGGLRRQRFVGKSIQVGSTSWMPLVDLPSRQTAYFEGRGAELDQLLAWCNDLESRACLLYGDGGIGKTTLALEFIHNLLERPPTNLLFRPEVICFYSAKLTRWTEHGVQHFSALQPVLEDSARQLLYALHDNLDRGWWRTSGQALIDRVASEFRSLGIERNAALLIVDNAETLSTKPGDDQILGELISAISRKVARVLVTSRRREKIEALPIEVAPLNDEDGCALLRRLGSELGAAAIVAAGDSRLRKESRNLHGKPLLLEALARHVANSGLSIDAAKAQILRDAQDGLSEFLYQDAWARISDEHKSIFIVLTELDLPVTNHLVGWTCSLVGAPHMSWLSAFDETHFGSKLEYGGDYEIEIAPMAAAFFRLKGQRLVGADRAVIDQIKEAVKRKQQDRERALSAPADDRIEAAFKTPEARAAKANARLGKLEDANLWYEEAVAKDSQNAALFDRYAWFLMQLKEDLDKAAKMSEIACRLDPKNAEAQFTRGLILYRRFDIATGDQAIDLAQKLGRPETTCLIQKARARLGNLRKNGNDVAARSALLSQAGTLLERARRSLVKGDRYYAKNVESCDKLESWIQQEIARGNLMNRGTYVG